MTPDMLAKRDAATRHAIHRDTVAPSDSACRIWVGRRDFNGWPVVRHSDGRLTWVKVYLAQKAGDPLSLRDGVPHFSTSHACGIGKRCVTPAHQRVAYVEPWDDYHKRRLDHRAQQAVKSESAGSALVVAC